MINLYADLVELGLRVIDPIEGKIAVPAFLRDAVRSEVERRKSLSKNDIL